MSEDLTALLARINDTRTADEYLDLEREAFYASMRAGDLAHADEHYARMDALLLHRFQLPQQRTATP